MKKVLFVIDSLEIGGIEKSLINLLKYINNMNKYDITLLSLVNGGQLEKDVPKDIKRIEIEKNKQRFLKPIRKEIKKLNLVYLISLLKYKKKVNNMQSGESIRFNVIKSLDEVNQKFDIAIAYTDSSSLFFVCEKVNAKNKYVWVHMDYTKKNNRPVFHSKFYNKMNKIICVSEKSKISFDLLNPKLKSRTCVIHNMLDINRIDALSKEKCNEFDKEYFNIVSVGRLSKEKNYEKLILSFSKLLKILNKKVRLYIIGNGIEYNNLKNIIKKEKLEKTCFLLGSKNNPYKYMKNCDLYTQVSIREGFGMTLYEAMYLKKPILSTEVSIIDELFTNNYDVLVVKNDINSISEGLYYIITNDELRKKFVKNLNKKKIISDMYKLISLLNGERNEKNKHI